MQANFQPVVINTSFLDRHPLYPDTSAFPTAQWSTGYFFLGNKVTPSANDEDRFVALYYRELDESVVVEIWPSAVAPGELGETTTEMSCAEYAWLLGFPVDDLSVASAIPELQSEYTNNTLYQCPLEPSAGYIPANLRVDVNTPKANPQSGELPLLHKHKECS